VPCLEGNDKKHHLPTGEIAMRRYFITAALLAITLSSAAAQEWPTQPIKYIVPFPPGGSTDMISRALAEELRQRLGQPVVVENIGGAGASIGTARLKQAKPDGYTIALGNSASHTITPHLLVQPPYDPLSDFTPISILTEYANVLVVAATSPAQDLKQFLALAKSKPDGLRYGTAGIGSSNHLSSVLLGQMAKVEFTHVPYKGNSAALTDLMGGQTDWMFATISEVLPFVESGKLRALGISSRSRDTLLPQVAPIAEVIPGYEVIGFMGLFGPAKLPNAIAARLNREVVDILRSPALAERFAQQGMRPQTSTPGELEARVKLDNATWKAVIRDAGVKPE
jgi:tripartite-type tricarboxylate transporter receptor subunit TctC